MMMNFTPYLLMIFIYIHIHTQYTFIKNFFLNQLTIYENNNNNLFSELKKIQHQSVSSSINSVTEQSESLFEIPTFSNSKHLKNIPKHSNPHQCQKSTSC